MNDISNENIWEVLFSHTKLYILADKWGVDSLKKLILLKLHQTLSMLSLNTPKVQGIVDLARYAYSDEGTPDLESGIDGLRELICQYIVANAEVMSEHATFRSMIEGEYFVRDLWKLAAPRIRLNN